MEQIALDAGINLASALYEGAIKPYSKRANMGYLRGTNKAMKATSDYKLKVLQRRISAITPETKIITFSSVLTIADGAAGGVDIFALIAEGTADNERIGDKIKVKSVEIRGIHSENQDSVDLYVVNPIDHSLAPAFTDFVGSPGGHYFKNKGYEVYYKGVTTGSSVNDACNFRKYYNKSPLNVHYDSSNAPDKNRFWCIIINRSGGSLTSRLSFKIKYTD